MSAALLLPCCCCSAELPHVQPQVWRSIIGEQPSFSRGGWQDITEPAKDFCRSLLNK
jgi:hypothetical protein